MICTKCNTEVVNATIDYSDNCIELGEVLYRDIEARTCTCGDEVWFSVEQARVLERKRSKLISELISKLPLGLFVPREKTHPTNFIITTKVGRQVLIYRTSLEHRLAVGDGRLNLVAELTKHNIVHTFHVSRIVRQGRIEA
jgi:hypothetical protein